MYLILVFFLGKYGSIIAEHGLDRGCGSITHHRETKSTVKLMSEGAEMVQLV